MAQGFYKPQGGQGSSQKYTAGSDGFFSPSSGQGGQYDLDDISDVCLVEDYQEYQQAADDNQMMNNIVKAYELVLQEKTLSSQKALQDEQAVMKKEHAQKMANDKKRMEDDKQKIRKKLGDELFGDVYSYLVGQRQDERCDEGEMFEHLKAMVGNNKRLLTEVFKLDGIVFKEIVTEKGIKH